MDTSAFVVRGEPVTVVENFKDWHTFLNTILMPWNINLKEICESDYLHA